MQQRMLQDNENIEWLLNLTNAFTREEFIVSNMKFLPKQLIEKDTLMQAEIFTQCQETQKFTLQSFKLFPNMLVKDDKYLILSTCYLEKKRIQYKEFSVQGVALNNQLGQTFLFFKSYYQLSEWQKQLKRFCKMSNFLQKFTLVEKTNASNIFTCIKNKSKQYYTVSIYKLQDFAKAPATYEQLMNEINILMSLKHPCLLNYIGLYEDTQFTFVLYELWIGQPLYKIFDSGYRYSSIQIAKIIYSLIKFVSQLHLQNLYHAQITPQNIYVLQEKNSEDIQIVLTNFAFREQNQLQQLKKKLPQQWISPEVLNNSNSVPSKLDVYQIGITMYYLFTYQPFDNTDFSLFQKTILNFFIQPYEQLKQEYETKSSKVFTLSELDLLLSLLNPVCQARKDLNQLSNHHWFVNQIAKSKSQAKFQLLPSLRTILEIREQSSMELKFQKSAEYSNKVSIISIDSSDDGIEDDDEEEINFLDLISQEENQVSQFIKTLNNQLIVVRKL